MEPAHHNCKVLRAELAREVECARKLVRLHADQADEAAARRADALDHALNVDDRVALVIGLDDNIDVGAEYAVLRILGEEAVDACQAI
jgi:hypothetical protein